MWSLITTILGIRILAIAPPVRVAAARKRGRRWQWQEHSGFTTHCVVAAAEGLAAAIAAIS